MQNFHLYIFRRSRYLDFLSVPSEHVALQSKWQSADLDFVTLAKKRKSVWSALFRGNVCI